MLKDKNKRLVLFTLLSIPFNIIVAIGKILIGLWTQSLFMFMNAACNAGIAAAKGLCIKDHINNVDRNRQCRTFKHVGVIIIVSCLLYILYIFAAGLFDDGAAPRYPKNIALIIAVITGVELYCAISGMIFNRRKALPLFEAVKLVNLASVCISLVLMQTVIVSFIYGFDPELLNGVSGLAFGDAALAIGAYMIVRAKNMQKPKYREKFVARILDSFGKAGVFGVQLIGGGEDVFETRILSVDISGVTPQFTDLFAKTADDIFDRFGITIRISKDIEQSCRTG